MKTPRRSYHPEAAVPEVRELAEAASRLFTSFKPQFDREIGNTVEDGIRVRSESIRSVTAYDGILTSAHENDIDLIVMGSHGRSGLGYVLLGSVAQMIARHARCSVMVVRQEEKKFVDMDGRVSLDRILFPTDLSEASRQAAPWALHLAQKYRATLLVTHVIKFSSVVSYGMSDEDTAEEAAEALRRRADTAVRDEAHRLFAGYKNKEVLLVVGPVGRTIADTARKEDADLIVVSPSGRNDWKGKLLGSTSERLLRRAPCPVLVAR